MITISTLPFVPNYIFVDKNIFIGFFVQREIKYLLHVLLKKFSRRIIYLSVKAEFLGCMIEKKHFILFCKLLFYFLWFHDAIYFIIINKCSWRHRKLQLFFLTTYNRELKKNSNFFKYPQKLYLWTNCMILAN